MSSPAIWSAGRYESVASHLAGIAARTVEAVGQRVPLHNAALVDLACGTGSGAFAAADRGALVTAVDLTPELIALAEQRAGDRAITWLTADAAATGLPDASFDAVVSNMGIVFVEPVSQVAEIARLLKPQGALAFSAWVRATVNPIYDPIVAVLGPPAGADYYPDQWGDPDIARARLADHFTDIVVDDRVHTWAFPSLEETMRFLRDESPLHVMAFRFAGERTADLAAAFEDALRPCVDADGRVAFDVPYVVVSAIRAA